MTDIAVAAAGAAWEPAALAAIEQATQLRLARRCVDVAELLAVARTGAVSVAVVDPALPGLDVDVIAELTAAGVVLAACGDAAAAGALGIGRRPAPHELGSVDWSTPQPVPRPPSTPTVSQPAGPRASTTVVWGPVGAPGRSIVAMSIASILASRGRATTLIDADVGGGTMAQYLGVLDDLSGILAACRAAGNGRAHEIGDHLVEIEPRLTLLTGLPRPDMWSHLRIGALGTVVDRLGLDHADLVFDVGAGIDLDASAGRSRHEVTRHLLETADTIVVVGRADPVGLARLIRALDDLRDQVGREPTVVALNGFRPTVGWSAREITATMTRLCGRAPDVIIPSDVPAVDAAMMRGSALVRASPRTPIAAALEDLVSAFLTDVPVIASPSPR